MDVVVDATVWLSAAHSGEPHHDQSVRFIREAMTRKAAFMLPVLVLPEVAATAARRAQDPTAGVAMLEQLLQLPNVQYFELTQARARAAAELAARLHLRGVDAQYAALAAELGVPLVTLDRELRERSATAFECLTPAEWSGRLA